MDLKYVTLNSGGNKYLIYSVRGLYTARSTRSYRLYSEMTHWLGVL